MKRFLKFTLFTIILFLVGIIRVRAADNITITDVELQEKSEYTEVVEEVSLDNNKITSNVNFFDEGDYVIYKLTIKNNDDQDYKIEDILDDNTSEYLSFEYDYEDGVIKAKSEKEVLLKITYVSLLPYDSVLTPEHTFNASTEVNISFKLTDYVSNPSTLDRIGKQSFTVILCVLLLFAFVKLRKSKFLYVLVLGLFLIPIGTNAEREITFNIKLNNTIEASVNFLAQNWKSKISGEFSKIEFVKRASFPNDAVDVSQEQDNSIKAWIEDDTLYFGSRYKIFFPVISAQLFQYLDVTEINFNNRVDTTFVTNMSYMFAYDKKLYKVDVDQFRTGNVENMAFMFLNVGKETTNDMAFDLTNFDTSKVTNMMNMFYYFGGSGKVSIGDISNWDVSNVTNMRDIFCYFMYYTTDSLSFDFSNWDVSNVQDFTDFLLCGGYNSKEVNITISNWNNDKATSFINILMCVGYNSDLVNISFTDSNLTNASNISQAFYSMASNAKELNFLVDNVSFPLVTSIYTAFTSIASSSQTVNITISNFSLPSWESSSTDFSHVASNSKKLVFKIINWDVPNLTNIKRLFSTLGYNCEDVDVLISNFNAPSLVKTESMFENLGGLPNSKKVHIKIEDFDTSNITNMDNMFTCTGRFADELEIEGLENFNYQNVTSMNSFMTQIGDNYKHREMGTFNIYGGNVSYSFSYNTNIVATINLYGTPTNYNTMFQGSATHADSEIIINYTSDVDIDAIMSSVPSGAHIYKGELIEA